MNREAGPQSPPKAFLIANLAIRNRPKYRAVNINPLSNRPKTSVFVDLKANVKANEGATRGTQETGRGGGDRKYYCTEFQRVRRNAGERQGIEKEQ